MADGSCASEIFRQVQKLEILTVEIKYCNIS